jgi:5,10-methylene-tetrahydrofolate dehydrogenase/methenyl tetrahydrofolate cyclohydrolase
LVAAAARTSADVAVVGRASLGGEPAAALLRWDESA